MKQITMEKWKKIPKDYKDKINGKRTVFAGSIDLTEWEGERLFGTSLVIEGTHFEIVKERKN